MKTRFTKILFAALSACAFAPDAAAQYCPSMATSTMHEEITNFSLHTLNNPSTCTTLGPGPGSIAAQYANYTSGPGAPAAPSVTQGLSYSLSVTIQSCNTSNRTSGAAVFIDYNVDGDFVDPGEKVWNTPLSANINCVPGTTVTGSIVIPLTATPGLTRLRVINANGYSGPSMTPCITYQNGETEDYLVNIVLAPPVDLSIIDQPLPGNTTCYSANETVSVTLYNQGSQPINFATNPATINTSVTGPNPATFTPVVVNSGTLAVGSTITVPVTTTYSMALAGTYQFLSSITISGDGNTSNNTLPMVTHIFSAGMALTPGTSRVCTGSPSNIPLLGLTPAGCTVQWQQSTDNSTWTNIVGQTGPTMTAPIPDTMFYRVVACGLIASVSDTAFTINLPAPVTVNDTVCGFGNISVSAATTAGSIDWYNAPSGGTQLGSGNTYATSIAATDTFWAQTALIDCGLNSTPVTPVCYPVFTYGCSSGDMIDDFSTAGGSTNISNLNSGCNGSLPSNTTFFPSQIVTCAPGATFTFTIESGPLWSQTYRIWIDYNNDGDFADVGEDAWDSGAQTPGPISGSITVPVAIGAGPKRIRLMSSYAAAPSATEWCSARTFGEVEEYTLVVCSSCFSVRSPAIGVSTPAPVVNVVSSNNSCGTQTSTLTASSSNPAYTYSWSPSSTLNASTGTTVIASPTTTTTYTVTGTDSSTGCRDSASVQVIHWALPSVTASTTDNIICPGDSTTLSVTTTMPNPVIVGVHNQTNTSTSWPAPYGNSYWGSKHQMLIRASDLTAMGMVPGYIGSLTFDVVSTNGSQPLENFQIRLGVPMFNSLYYFHNVPLTTVYSVSSYTPAAGLNTHVFSTPYYWNGTSDLLIETCHSNTSATSNCSFRLTNTPAYLSCVTLYHNVTTVCDSMMHMAAYTRRPVMHFNMLYTAGWTYAWTPSSTLSNPASATTGAEPAVSTTYSVTVTDSNGCASVRTVAISVVPPPAPSLGPDTSICSNTSLVLNAGSGPYTYLWQNSTTASTLTVNTAGPYSVVVTSTVSGCSGADTVNVGVVSAPAVSLGPDLALCTGDSVTLTGPSGMYDYLWNTTDTTSSITINTAGSYALAVTDASNGCADADTVNIVVNPVPVFSLGNDRTICAGNSVLFSAPMGPYEYDWNTGDSIQNILANTSGAYIVTVTNSGTGCSATDTAMLTVNPLPVVTITLPVDTACLNAGAVPLGGSPSGGVWLGPGVTGSMFNPASTGVGVFGITYTYTDSNGCSANDVDSILVDACLSVAAAPGTTIAFSAFPNPNAGTFRCTANGLGTGEVLLEIIAADGKVIQSRNVTPVNGRLAEDFDVSNCANGIYLLQLTTESGVQTLRLTKQE